MLAEFTVPVQIDRETLFRDTCKLLKAMKFSFSMLDEDTLVARKKRKFVQPRIHEYEYMVVIGWVRDKVEVAMTGFPPFGSFHDPDIPKWLEVLGQWIGAHIMQFRSPRDILRHYRACQDDGFWTSFRDYS